MKKILLIVSAVIVAIVLVAVFVVKQQSGYTKVLTAKIQRQDLATVVSGTGQIRPKTFVNVGATSFGRITHLMVKEGDHVKRGQVIATVENVQPEANVQSQKATISAARTDISSYIAAEKTAEANVEHAKADLEQKQLDWDRAQSLLKAGIMAKQDYDAKKAAYDTDVASVSQAVAQLNQAKAQTASAHGHLDQQVAQLRFNEDALSKTVSIAPFDGIVTNLPVREGETVVVGIQNAEGSTLMTIATSMSVASLRPRSGSRVKPTRLPSTSVNGQPADVSIDAISCRHTVFKGSRNLPGQGDQALLRSTGIATSQSTTGTEEAKDFKVVVTLDTPTDEMRPGLSTTAKITTAAKSSVLSLPIQALTMYTPPASTSSGNVEAASTSSGAKVPPVQGVYIVEKDAHGKQRAKFVPVTTGITGATDIEVLSGLHQGDEVVIGPYKTLRVLKNGALLKRDTSVPATPASTT